MTEGQFSTLSSGDILSTDDGGVVVVETGYHYKAGAYRVDLLVTLSFEPVVIRGLEAEDLRDFHLTGQRMLTY